MKAISKHELVSSYYKALREAREEMSPSLFETGSLTIAPVGVGL